MESARRIFCLQSTHAVAISQNGAEDPEQAVAVVKIIEFCEKTGAVKLPQIEFLSDSDGAKRIIETAKTGKKYCSKRSVSERRCGHALFGAV